VILAKSHDKTITDFRFLVPAAIRVIDEENTILLSVPYGTDVLDLVPSITHTGASISPQSGMAIDFNNPVEFVVVAEDTTVVVYTVTVIVAPSASSR